MSLSINPYLSVGDICFGMNENEVKAIAGKPQSSQHVFIDDTTKQVTEEIRNKICYQYQDGKLACVAFDATALAKNEVIINDQRIPCTLMELLKFFTKISTQIFKVRNPFSYLYEDLGIVLYNQKIVDIKMGIQSTDSKSILAVCNKSVFRKYAQYFFSNLSQAENFDTQIFDVINSLLENE